MKSKLLTDNINRYNISKTLRFELIPQGKTLEYITEGAFLSDDDQRAQDYKKMKKTIDEFHKYFIDLALSELKNEASKEPDNKKSFSINDLQLFEYAYNQLKKSRRSDDSKEKDKAKKAFEKEANNLRKKFVNRSFKNENVKKIYSKLFSKELIKEILPEFIKNDSPELFFSENFKNFTTHFTGFNENRENIYSDKEQSTSLAYRLIDENLLKFIDNIDIYKNFKAENILPLEKLNTEEKEFYAKYNLDEIFDTKYYINTLRQSDIDKYNTLIGGQTLENKNKIRGLNEFINLHKQADKSKKKHPLFKELYKQILADRDSISFLPASFDNTKEVYESINQYYKNLCDSSNPLAIISGNILKDFRHLLDSLKNKEYNLDEIYIPKASIANISQSIFGKYSTIFDALDSYYQTNPKFGYANSIAKAKNKSNTIAKINEKKELFLSKEYQSISELENAINSYIKKINSDNSNSNEMEAVNLNAYFIENLEPTVDGKSHTIESLLKERFSTIKGELEKTHDDAYFPNKQTINAIKTFLDEIVKVIHYLKMLNIKSKDKKSLNLDSNFYNTFDTLFEDLSKFTKLYDKVRNYLTKKPFSQEKYKLTFNEPTLGDGWDLSKEEANKCIILKRNNQTYLAVINRKIISTYKTINAKNIFNAKEDSTGDYFEKMIYKYTPDASKQIPKCSTQLKDVVSYFKNNDSDYIIDNPKKFKEKFVITKEIFELNNPEEESLKKFQSGYLQETGDSIGYKDALTKWINFCLDFCKKYNSTSFYDFSILKSPQQYSSLNEFYTQLNKILYSINFKKITKTYIDDLVDKGLILLFKIHNKDFNEGAKGTPNMHTLYWKAIFDAENLKDPKVRLNGGAELFFRKASIKANNIYKHKVGETLINKTDKFGKAIPDDCYIELSEFFAGKIGKDKLSNQTLPYLDNIVKKIADREIVKDKRYTQDKFFFHVPILLNAKADNKIKLNDSIKEILRTDPTINIIGIDRGERHLLYCSVINQNGDILEQKTFNTITEKRNDGSLREVDYHSKLDTKEKNRDKARKEWGNIEKIADLKQGYLSNVIHEICLMIEKYNAIVILEDLNFGFKRGRFKVEKQVYQNFEKALINKLNFLTFKNKSLDEDGGILKAYQLTEKFESFAKMGKQNGILFYLAAANTSKIDPLTGYVNNLRPKYVNVDESKKFFSKFSKINYDNNDKCFNFIYDEKDFFADKPSKVWTIKTWGDCRYKFNPKANNNKGGIQTHNVSQSLIESFERVEIDYTQENLVDEISKSDDSKFLKDLIWNLNLVLAMRYSYKEDDFILSAVVNAQGKCYNSRKVDSTMPKDADANGAYNIARKGIILINNIKEGKEKPLIIKNEDWFAYAQSEEVVSAQNQKIK